MIKIYDFADVTCGSIIVECYGTDELDTKDVYVDLVVHRYGDAGFECRTLYCPHYVSTHVNDVVDMEYSNADVRMIKLS